MADILASVSVVLGAEVSGFKAAMADARRELKGLQQFSEGLQGAGDSLTRYLTAPLVGIGVASLASSAKLESLRKGLEAVAQQELGKSGLTGLSAMSVAAQQTGERLKELLQVAKAPGLSFEGAEAADIRLRAVGISAEQSAKSIKAFANAIATTGGGTSEFDRVTTQLAQLSAKGKVLAQDLRPIIEAAPSVAGALQRLYGTVDSETISASLAKQGQSSKEFIRILTDELAKLPQVSGGLKAIYENDMDALLVASAKVGDGIAKAFNLQAVGETLGNQITALGDSFAELSAPAQGAIVTFAGLAAATGPVLLGLGTLGLALPSIKAGIVAVESAATLLKTGLVSLLNPATLAIAGLAALAGGAYYLATANQRLLDSYREQAAATRQLTTEVSPLLDRYDELRAKTSLTTAEQAELKAIVEKVTAVMPAAGQGLDGYGNYLGLATDKARAFIQQNQGLDKAIALQSLPAQQRKLVELTQTYDRLLDERDQLSRGSFNSVKIDDLGAQFLVDFRQELAATATELDKQRRLVAELGAAAGVTATEYDAIAVTLPGLAANLAKLRAAFPVVDFSALGGGVTVQLGLLATLKARLKEVQDQRDKETTVGDIKVDNAEIISLQKQIAALEGTEKAGKKATDAITKLRKELIDNANASRALGDLYDYNGGRAKVLEAGIKSLTDAGFGPANKVVQAYVAQLRAVPQALDQLAGRTVKGSEKLFETPDFELPKLPTLETPQVAGLLPDYGQIFSDAAKAVLAGSQKLTQAQLTALDRQRDFNTNIEALFDQLNGSVGPTLAGFAAQFGDAFGSVVTGASSAQDALQTLFSGILQGLSSFMSSFGQQLIAIGIGKLALDALFTGPQGGVLAIAAGAGLVALAGIASSVAKGAASSLGSISNGGAASSSMSSPKAANYGQTSNSTQKIVVEVVSRLRAGDLVAVGRGDAYRNRVGG